MRAKILTLVVLAVAAVALPAASFAGGPRVGVSIAIGGPPVAYYPPPPVVYYPPPPVVYTPRRCSDLLPAPVLLRAADRRLPRRTAGVTATAATGVTGIAVTGVTVTAVAAGIEHDARQRLTQRSA